MTKDQIQSLNKIKTEITCLKLKVNVIDKEEYLKRVNNIDRELKTLLKDEQEVEKPN